MTKQQLAARIWESANKMRNKIEASEYKDYILGLIFYRFLSDEEVKWLKTELGCSDNDIKDALSDLPTIEQIKSSLGYYIAYDNLFTTWFKKHNFSIKNVSDALIEFTHNIDSKHKKLFDKIFDSLQVGLGKLGDNTAAQTKAVSKLITLIRCIPMNDRNADYDVLGFIYEYLIGMFAANGGKKAGEFYTPHEVSLLMSEIIAEHHKDKKTLKIYDPTCGSGSLLINIGKTASKYMDKDSIQYYAQELIGNTYNLMRMNLVMRGIKVANINTRQADTLEDDWPIFDENGKKYTVDKISKGGGSSRNYCADQKPKFCTAHRHRAGAAVEGKGQGERCSHKHRQINSHKPFERTKTVDKADQSQQKKKRKPDRKLFAKALHKLNC